MKELIEELNKHRYTVIIADLRGHGESINDEYKHGMIGDIDLMVDDEDAIEAKLYVSVNNGKSFASLNY